MAQTNVNPFRDGVARGLDPATRQRIEDAVLDIFSGREFHRVSLIEIARAANVSLQTIYKYYGSKETLLFASLNSWMSILAHRMMDNLQAIDNDRDRLHKAFAEALRFFEENPKVGELILSSIYFNTWRDDETFKQTELTRLFLQVLHDGRARGVLDDSVDETVLLDFIYGTIVRTVTMWIIRGREGSLSAQADALFRLLWRAIAKPPADNPAR